MKSLFESCQRINIYLNISYNRNAKIWKKSHWKQSLCMYKPTTKAKFYKEENKNNSHYERLPSEKTKCSKYLAILLDFVTRSDKNYYPEVLR